MNLISFIAFSQNRRVDVAKSIVNVTDINGGGTFNPGDIIEIRVTIAVMPQSGTRTIIDRVSVNDVVPANTTYINGSMRVTTNEGITYKGPFTEANDGDAGTKSGNNILINLGRHANGTTGGRIRSDSSKPSLFGSSSIMMACYRVRINAAAPYGTVITTGGSITYRTISPTPVATTTTNFPTYRILLFNEENACSNGMSVSAASDFQGTFGDGNTHNRAAALAFTTTYAKITHTTTQPNDYYYSIVNNTSGTGSTNPIVGVPNSNRVFTYWDIGGDHTGATNQTMGNPPVAPGTNGGYMVVVNASYKTDTAYRETLNNLCPNTYYQFSAWVRNICPRCSCDSMGRGSGTAGFIPAAGNDSSGVKPNISFEIDGNIYYTSGDISYSRTTPWRKYGFTFLTGPSQTTANFLIRNNSPGGGGNDWALDDISVSHCGPDLSMNYAPIALGCSANPFAVYLSDTVRYAFNNSYVHFKWQISNVGGTVWTDMTGPGTSGVGIPSVVNGQYQYVTNLPPFLAYPADSGKYFRVYVATTSANLNNNCAYTDGSVRMISVINCGMVLSSKFLQFHGRLDGRRSRLVWRTSEENISHYEIESSHDAVNFSPIGRVEAVNSYSASYSFEDPDIFTAKKHYRIKMVGENNLYKYSHIVTLGASLSFNITGLENPFDNDLSMYVVAPEDGIFNYAVTNNQGKTILTGKVPVQKGINPLTINTGRNISSGICFLTGTFGQEKVRKKLVRLRP